MKKYNRPEILIEEVSLEEVILSSGVGSEGAGDFDWGNDKEF